MKLFLLFVCGCLVGAASWPIAGAFSGRFEPFDSTVGFYVCQAVVALPALWSSLRFGLLRTLPLLLGAWVGMNVYAYLFGSDETRAWMLLGLFSSLTLLMIPLAMTMLGAAVGAVRRRTSARTSNAPARPSHDSHGRD